MSRQSYVPRAELGRKRPQYLLPPSHRLCLDKQIIHLACQLPAHLARCPRLGPMMVSDLATMSCGFGLLPNFSPDFKNSQTSITYIHYILHDTFLKLHWYRLGVQKVTPSHFYIALEWQTSKNQLIPFYSWTRSSWDRETRNTQTNGGNTSYTCNNRVLGEKHLKRRLVKDII